MDLQRSAEPKRRHPPGLYYLFFTEMWERFSYYLMIGIFSLFLTDSQTGGMGWSEEKAAGVVGTLWITVRSRSVSDRTRSVKVPPTSTPISFMSVPPWGAW